MTTRLTRRTFLTTTVAGAAVVGFPPVREPVFAREAGDRHGQGQPPAHR